MRCVVEEATATEIADDGCSGVHTDARFAEWNAFHTLLNGKTGRVVIKC